MPSLNKCVTDFWIDQNTGTYKYILSNDTTLVYRLLPMFLIGWDYNAPQVYVLVKNQIMN